MNSWNPHAPLFVYEKILGQATTQWFLKEKRAISLKKFVKNLMSYGLQSGTA